MTMSIIEKERPGTTPPGERTARIALAALGDRLRMRAHDADRTLTVLCEDVSKTYWQVMKDVAPGADSR
jgi:hypothetical protein